MHQEFPARLNNLGLIYERILNTNTISGAKLHEKFPKAFFTLTHLHHLHSLTGKIFTDEIIPNSLKNPYLRKFNFENY